MIATILRHESGSLLRSAQTWLLAAALAVLFGFLFLQQIENWLAVQERLALEDHPPGLTGFLAARFLAPSAMVFSLVAPLLAMRSFSDEFRHATYPLWRSSPVTVTALVLGKFLGVLVVVLGLVALAVAPILSMTAFVSVDAGTLAAAALGLALASAAFTAVGLFFSSLTSRPTIAILAALALLLPLWLLGGVVDAALPFLPPGTLAALAIGERLGGFFQGYVRSDDVAYFVLLVLLFLALTAIRLDALGRTER